MEVFLEIVSIFSKLRKSIFLASEKLRPLEYFTLYPQNFFETIYILTLCLIEKT